MDSRQHDSSSRRLQGETLRALGSCAQNLNNMCLCASAVDMSAVLEWFFFLCIFFIRKWSQNWGQKMQDFCVTARGYTQYAKRSGSPLEATIKTHANRSGLLPNSFATERSKGKATLGFNRIVQKGIGDKTRNGVPSMARTCHPYSVRSLQMASQISV